MAEAEARAGRGELGRRAEGRVQQRLRLRPSERRSRQTRHEAPAWVLEVAKGSAELQAEPEEAEDGDCQ